MAGDIPVPESVVVMPEDVGMGARAAVPTVRDGEQQPYILHRYGPRVAIVLDPTGAEREGLEELTAPGALLGAPSAIPQDALEGLDPTGRLGLQALALRRSDAYAGRKANRPRDGESWDAEGTQSPDAPYTMTQDGAGAGTDTTYGVTGTASAAVPAVPAARTAEELEEQRALAVIAPPSATSGRLAGTIAVGIVIVDGPTPETRFTDAERVEVVAEVQNGLTWLGTQTTGAPVTWSYEIRNVSVNVPPMPLVSVVPKHSGKRFDIEGASTANGARLIQWDDNGGHNQHFSMEPLDDGTFRFVAEHSGLVLDVEGASTAAGARIIQWPWHGGDNQRFRVEDLGDGVNRIIAKHSGLVLDVEGASTASGAQVIQWTWNGGDNQRFTFDSLGGEREARWRDPAVVALGHQGNWDGVWDYINDLRRRLGTEWTYCGFFTKYPLGWFAYANIGGPRIVMDYANDGWGPANIDRVFAHESGHIFNCPDEYAKSGCDCGGQWGYWRTPNGNCENCAPGGGIPCLMKANTWAICEYTTSQVGWTSPWALGTAMIAKHSGRAVDVSGASTDAGAALIQWDWHDQLNQRFRFDALDDGTYRIAAQHSGKVLDVEGASTAAGARIIQWDWHGGDNQRFRLEPLQGGGTRLVAKHSGMVFDIAGASTANGAQLIQWDWNGGDNQQFRLEGVPMFAAHSGKVLDITGASTADGAALIQWDHHGGLNQILRADPLGSYQYRLVCLNSAKVLDVSGASTADGAAIVQWGWHGGNNQRFRFEPSIDGRMQVIAVHSGKVFDVSGAAMTNGATVIQWPAHGGANQAFRLLAARITPKHSGKALDVEGNSMAAGARLIQWDWHGGNNQRFRLEPLGDGTYRIVAESSGRVMDISGASTGDGAQVIQWDWHGGSNQRFRLEPLGDGYHRIVAVHSGKVLDVFGASTASGAQLIQWPWNGGDNQRFRL
jgi:Ricin-type beta-trefoil lectin domain-like